MQPLYWPSDKQQPGNVTEALTCPSAARGLSCCSCGWAHWAAEHSSRKATIRWSRCDCTAFHLHHSQVTDFTAKQKAVGNVQKSAQHHSIQPQRRDMKGRCWGMIISSVRQQVHIPGLLFLKHDGAQAPAAKQPLSSSNEHILDVHIPPGQ